MTASGGRGSTLTSNAKPAIADLEEAPGLPPLMEDTIGTPSRDPGSLCDGVALPAGGDA